MCKEKLKLEKDGAPKQLSHSEADENCYFVSAKKIRVSLKNKTSGQVEKKEVTVHVECMKQLEEMKQQREHQKQRAEILGKRQQDPQEAPLEKR